MPRQLSADCGMAIKFSGTLLAEVQSLLDEQNVPIIELYQKKDGELGFAVLKGPVCKSFFLDKKERCFYIHSFVNFAI